MAVSYERGVPVAVVRDNLLGGFPEKVLECDRAVAPFRSRTFRFLAPVPIGIQGSEFIISSPLSLSSLELSDETIYEP